jgi:hypothetical protein
MMLTNEQALEKALDAVGSDWANSPLADRLRAAFAAPKAEAEPAEEACKCGLWRRHNDEEWIEDAEEAEIVHVSYSQEHHLVVYCTCGFCLTDPEKNEQEPVARYSNGMAWKYLHRPTRQVGKTWCDEAVAQAQEEGSREIMETIRAAGNYTARQEATVRELLDCFENRAREEERAKAKQTLALLNVERNGLYEQLAAVILENESLSRRVAGLSQAYEAQTAAIHEWEERVRVLKEALAELVDAAEEGDGLKALEETEEEYRGETDAPEAWDPDTCAGCADWHEALPAEWEHGEQITPGDAAGCWVYSDRAECEGKHILVTLPARAGEVPK